MYAPGTGILTLQPTSQPKTKADGLRRHQIVMLIGLSSILLGTSAVFVYKGSQGAPHYTTWHGVRAPPPPSFSTLTSIHFLDLWPDHRFLAHRSVHGWRVKCLVWRRRLRGQSQSQARVEVSQAVGLHPITFPLNYR